MKFNQILALTALLAPSQCFENGTITPVTELQKSGITLSQDDIELSFDFKADKKEWPLESQNGEDAKTADLTYLIMWGHLNGTLYSSYVYSTWVSIPDAFTPGVYEAFTCTAGVEGWYPPTTKSYFNLDKPLDELMPIDDYNAS